MEQAADLVGCGENLEALAARHAVRSHHRVQVVDVFPFRRSVHVNDQIQAVVAGILDMPHRSGQATRCVALPLCGTPAGVPVALASRLIPVELGR